MPLRLATCLFIAAAPIVAAAQPATTIPARRDFAHGQHVRTEFHAPSGWTIVELLPVTLRTPPTPVALRTSFRFQGRTLEAPPPTLTFAIVAQGGMPLFGAKPVLAIARDGGAPEKVAVQAWRKQEGPRVHETVYATLPRATFLRLVSASAVELRVDTMTFALGAAELEALRDLASRMSPAGYARAVREEGKVAEAPAPAAGGDAPLGARDVDQVVRAAGLLSRPAFPAGVERTARRVHFRYVVDTLGRIEPGSLRGETPVADAPFLAAIEAVAGKWLFQPAKKDGRRVRQEVRQVLTFDPSLP